jgi:hypothetical protein
LKLVLQAPQQVQGRQVLVGELIQQLVQESVPRVRMQLVQLQVSQLNLTH